MTDGHAPRRKGVSARLSSVTQDQSRRLADQEATKARRSKRVITQWEGLWVVFEDAWMIGAGFADRAEAQAWADTAEVRLPSDD